MKFIEKLSLLLFSSIMLLISIIACLVVFGWIDIPAIAIVLKDVLNNPKATNVVLGCSIVFILLAIKCIFFDSGSNSKSDSKEGVLLENNNGKLLISKDTIENLVSRTVKEFSEAEAVSTKVILDRENNVMIEVTLYVAPNSIIKELSINLQNKIKDVVKKVADLDIKEINIKIENIATERALNNKGGKEKMDNFKNFVNDYRGAIIGGIIAILILCTNLYKLIIGIILFCIGVFIGNYVQKNKYDVKEKLKDFIDRM